jgi:hypothetical protein
VRHRRLRPANAVAVVLGALYNWSRRRDNPIMVDEPNLPSSALRALSIFCQLKNDVPWLMTYCSAEGGLLDDMEQFLRSLGKLLRSEFAIYDWRLKPGEREDPSVSLKLFPANWDLSGLGAADPFCA